MANKLGKDSERLAARLLEDLAHVTGQHPEVIRRSCHREPTAARRCWAWLLAHVGEISYQEVEAILDMPSARTFVRHAAAPGTRTREILVAFMGPVADVEPERDPGTPAPAVLLW